MSSFRASVRSLAPRLGYFTLFSGLLYVLVVCAWQADDAYITFRTVSNAWDGHGLTWNAGERVQTYTHPLWMMLAWACHGIFGEVYFSMLGLSMVLTLAVAAALARSARPIQWLVVPAVLVLSLSAAFVDYAVSGLENPLLCLLLVLFVCASGAPVSGPRLRRMALLAAAIGLTRLDALLFVVPALGVATLGLRSRRSAVRNVGLGLLPLFLWGLFSLVYYGSALPNTAFAKLNLEIPATELVQQGLGYLVDSLAHDPVTLATIALCACAALVRGTANERGLASGVVLYLAYVARIGGDFMSGRFLAAPLAMALAVAIPVACRDPRLARSGGWVAATAVGLLCLYGLAWPESRWRSGIDFGAGLSTTDIMRENGIADERAYYYPTTGLLNVLDMRDEIRANELPTPPFQGAKRGLRIARLEERVVVSDEVGYFGYFAGPGKTIVDVWALCDPLLARLPFRPSSGWRIGHFPRRIPAGYIESLRSGENRLRDPLLAEVYEGLRLVVRGPLFSRDRWREIWRFHSGYYREALDRTDYL